MKESIARTAFRKALKNGDGSNVVNGQWHKFLHLPPATTGRLTRQSGPSDPIYLKNSSGTTLNSHAYIYDNAGLRTQLEPGDKGAIATWQTRVLLPQGHYRVWASVASDHPIFRGPERPVNFKVWADQNLQSESLARDTQHLELANHLQDTISRARF